MLHMVDIHPCTHRCGMITSTETVWCIAASPTCGASQVHHVLDRPRSSLLHEALHVGAIALPQLHVSIFPQHLPLRVHDLCMH